MPKKLQRLSTFHFYFPILVVLFFILIFSSFSWSSPFQETHLEKSTKAAIIDWMCLKLDEIYVFPDVAKKMEEYLRYKLKNGDYDSITDPRAFTQVLRGDLIKVSHDRHFNVVYAPEPSIRMERPDPEEEKKREEQKIRQLDFDNYYFKKVERLDGNVGYMRFDGFADTLYAGDTAVAALQFLKNCDAIIIDLRYNGGGGADMIQLILSYFFKERTHINSWYIRREDKTIQSWTSTYVPGKKLLDIDLYILTSSRTFSAAEEFIYDLKNLDRATLVGETTGGGGHMVTFERNDELKIEFKIPFNRAVNPYSGDNWEAKGIEPHVKCPAKEALDKAYILALEKIHEKAGPEGNYKQWLAWLIDYIKFRANPIDVKAEVLQKYVGTYGPARVLFENGRLWLIQPGRTQKVPLLGMTEDSFIIDGEPDVRVKFEKNEQEEVTAALALFFDGSSDRLPKKK